MFDTQRSKQPEHDRSQAAPAQKTSKTKQHTGDLTRIPLYTQLAWGNQPPPWLRLPVQQKEPHEEESVKEENEPTQRKENTTGLPDTLKAGVEQLSGLSMDDVQVHYHSAKPAEVQALAYTQGTEIHVGPDQEKHLAHEAWHVVQQKQGRVIPMLQMQEMAINDDQRLEKEADVMGTIALAGSLGDIQAESRLQRNTPVRPPIGAASKMPVQRKTGFEFELTDINTQHQAGDSWVPHTKGAILTQKSGYSLTADLDDRGKSQLELITKEIDEEKSSDVTTLLTKTVPAAQGDIRAIIEASTVSSELEPGNWILASTVPGLGGRSSDRLKAWDPNVEGVRGQLQMTAGIRVSRLRNILSGHIAREISTSSEKEDFLSSYAQGTEWSAALKVVNTHNVTKYLSGSLKQQLASVVSLLATTPLNSRLPQLNYPKAATGKLLARTDFATIMMQLSDTIKAILTRQIMETLVINTIRHFAPHVQASDQIFPDVLHFTDISIPANMASLTIGRWVQALVPEPGRLWGYWTGQDLLTAKHFPGTAGQKKALESMGSFGGKMDPGQKPIFEFRSFRQVPLVSLHNYMNYAFEFLRAKSID